MTDAESRLELQRRLAAWSDTDGYRQAVDLADSHRRLLPAPVSSAQLNGLQSIVAGATTPRRVLTYVENQRDKAGRKDQRNLRQYWHDVHTALSELSEVAATFQDGDKDDVHVRLMEAFVQHLVAHSKYLGATR